MKKDGIHYFLGTNSPFGFVSFFEQLNDAESGIYCNVLKGGPGTGKSTLMKKVAAEMLSRDTDVDFVHCSSDPDSLDAVIIKDKKTCIADGTSPHVIEPAYPGAVENIINLGEAWESDRLRENREAIIQTTKENSAAHAMCIRFLKGAEVMIADSKRIQSNLTDKEKLTAYTERLAKRLFKRKPGNAKGKEQKIFLSAITPKGIVLFGNTVRALAEEIIVIDDSIGSVSSMMTEQLKQKAVDGGYDVISAFCPMNPKGSPEHIIIPECSLAFVRKHCSCQLEGTRTIHAKRFTDGDKLKEFKQRLAFNLKVRDDLILQAVSALKNAKDIHDKLEGYYVPNMDFGKIKEIQEELLRSIE